MNIDVLIYFGFQNDTQRYELLSFTVLYVWGYHIVCVHNDQTLILLMNK